ncbi:hypothetical protein QQF64_008676 [Cirrhinus molitorella]|uniref:Uncharacterized protein n=1 Tax=Cirrhinus molitorella TaxID=172907 RepID=A0ABR3MA74_9TELE
MTAELCHCHTDLPISMRRSYLNQPPPALTLYPDWDDNCNSWPGIRWAAPACAAKHGGSRQAKARLGTCHQLRPDSIPPSSVSAHIRFPDPAYWGSAPATPSLLHIIVLIAIST